VESATVRRVDQARAWFVPSCDRVTTLDRIHIGLANIILLIGVDVSIRTRLVNEPSVRNVDRYMKTREPNLYV